MMTVKRTSLFYINLTFAVIAFLAFVGYLLNYNPQSFTDEIALGIILLITPLMYLYLKRKTIKPLTSMVNKLASIRSGNLADKIDGAEVAELREVTDTVNQLTDSIQNALEFIKSIEEGDLTQEYNGAEDVDHEDVLKDVLIKMRTQMQKISEEDKQRNWIAEGLAQFGDLLRTNSNDVNELGQRVVCDLVKYLGINQGGLFILNDNNSDEPYLELISCYAYERKKYLDKKVEIGEGLLGQAFLEKQIIYLTEIPKNHINITSGLGEAPPRSLLIVPLIVNEEIYGVLEMASFDEFPKYKIEFIEKLAENIAATISSVKINSKTKALLEESQQQTEELRAQE